LPTEIIIGRHLIDCQCGCGKKIWNIDSQGRPRKYVQYHAERPKKYPCNLIDCACGCGTKIWGRDKDGRPTQYAKGHSNRGRKREDVRRRVGERHWRWKGGRYKDVHGYWLVKKPDHPQANNNGYVREHRLVYEDSRNCCIIPQLLGQPIHVHHRDGNRANNVWYNLMLVLKSEHTKIHYPRQDFNALCQCGSRNIHGTSRHDGKQYFHCIECNEYWSIPIPELEIMLKERNTIKNPRIGLETLGLKCICGSVDIIRRGTIYDKQIVECKSCSKSWRTPKLNVNKYKLSKRNKKLSLPIPLVQ
jgi:hypothetical protein